MYQEASEIYYIYLQDKKFSFLKLIIKIKIYERFIYFINNLF